MAIKASTAIASMMRFLIALRPIRSTASITTASTAALRPKKIATIHGTCPYSAYTMLRARMVTNPGSTNRMPAIRPPNVRCSIQPM